MEVAFRMERLKQLFVRIADVLLSLLMLSLCYRLYTLKEYSDFYAVVLIAFFAFRLIITILFIFVIIKEAHNKHKHKQNE